MNCGSNTCALQADDSLSAHLLVTNIDYLEQNNRFYLSHFWDYVNKNILDPSTTWFILSCVQYLRKEKLNMGFTTSSDVGHHHLNLLIKNPN